MEGFTLFESTVIGFFCGVVISTYIAFVDSTGRYLGSILNWVSLRPVVDLIASPEDKFMAVSFVLIILVYTLYGLIVGFLIKKSKKFRIFTFVIIIIFALLIFFQQNGQSDQALTVPTNEISSRPFSRNPEQYFGNEVVGDLNNDGRNDVAFILERDYADGTKSYYLSVALATSNGHKGTNIISLGDKLDPQKISINYGIIGVTYLDQTDNGTKTSYAKVNNGSLEPILIAKNSGDLSWGQIIYNEKVQTFKPCGQSDMLWLTAPASLLEKINLAEKSTLTQNSQANSTMFGAIVGKTIVSPAKGTGSSYKNGFSATDIITLVPNGACS